MPSHLRASVRSLYRSIYALADVCRSELLVEIEGVAFSNEKP